MSEETIKTDVALIKADIKNIEKFFGKVETSLDMMSDIALRVRVQEESIKNTIDRLEALDEAITWHRKEDTERQRIMMERLEEYRKNSYSDHQRLAEHNAQKRAEVNKELMGEIGKLNSSINTKLDLQGKRIAALENWRYYMMGVGGVLMFLLAKLNWPGLFG